MRPHFVWAYGGERSRGAFSEAANDTEFSIWQDRECILVRPFDPFHLAIDGNICGIPNS